MSRRRKKRRKRKCKCCHRWYLPRPHNAWHQRYCSKPICRIASHRDSQKRYNRKHPDRYKGDGDVLRVQNWREVHPFYWRRNPPLTRFVFYITHERCPSERLRCRFERFEGRALRDLYRLQIRHGTALMRRFRFALHNSISRTTAKRYSFGCSRQKALDVASIRASIGPPSKKVCRRKA
jgi:hypothetical protein